MNKRMSLYNEKVPFVIFYLISLICMISINAGTYSFSRISYLIIALVSICSSLETNIIIFFCLVPFPRIIMIAPSFFTLLPILELIIVCKWLISTRRYKCVYKEVICGACILIYSSIVEYARYSSISNSVEYSLKLFVILAISDIVNIQLTKKCFGFISLSVLLSLIAAQLLPALSDSVRMTEKFYTFRSNGLLSDPGEFGQLLVCSLASYIVYCLLKNDFHKQNVSLFDIISILFVACVFIYYMILSGTRTCLIGLGVLYVFIIIWLLKGKSKKAYVWGVIALAISLYGGLFLWRFIFQAFIESHGGESIGDDNRIGIWLNYLRYFKDEISIQFFGVGMDCSNTYGALHGLGNPHNILIEKVFECGLIGMILNGIFFVAVLKRKNCSILEKANLPFYVFFSTLFFYGSVGIELLYFLIGLLPSKNKNIFEGNNGIAKNISDVDLRQYSVCGSGKSVEEYS